MADDTVDVWLSQATMVAFAIPTVGPALAAVASISKALYDAYGKSEQPPRYTTRQAIADLGTKIQQLLEKQAHDKLMSVINGWELAVTSMKKETDDWTDQPDKDLNTFVDDRLADFEENLDFDTAIGSFSNDDKSEERVKSLDTYFKMRTAYHAVLQAKLEWVARIFNVPDLKDDKGNVTEAAWCTIGGDFVNPIRENLVKSLSDSADYADATITMLENAYKDLANFNETSVAKEKDPLKRNKLITKKMRALNASAHLQYADEDQVKRYRTFLNIYAVTLKGLKESPTTNDWKHLRNDASNQPSGGQKKNTGVKLGPRQAGTIRFMYESDANGGWVKVLSNSTVSPGHLVSQDAGSNDSSMYYQISGGTLNQEFATELDAAGLKSNANKDLIAQYNKKYNNEYDQDAKSARQDRLTSFLVMLDSDSITGGSDVVAMMYSVGPKLGSKGIENELVYKQIYLDTFAAIDNYNRKALKVNFGPIKNFRVTLLSTNAYAGSSDPTKLNAQAAGLVVDAALASMTKYPSLKDLTILINSNETKGGAERVAFETVAKNRGVTPCDDGFDLPLK